MNYLKVENKYPSKLSSSAVTESRPKASSMYQKRPENIPYNTNFSSNYLTPEYTPAHRKLSNADSGFKLTISDVKETTNVSLKSQN